MRGGEMRMWVGVAMMSALAGCAQPQPVCFRGEVQQEIGRIVRAGNVYDAIEPNVVSEGPGALRDVVVCTVSVTGVGYEATRTGWAPRQTRESRRFDVRVDGNRFVVEAAR